MARKLGNHKNFNGHQAINMLLELIAGDPSSPVEGRIWYDSTAKVFKYRTNNATIPLSGSLDSAGVQAIVNSMDVRNRATHTGTQLASTISDFAAAVDARVASVVDAAPAALDTLNELAAALGDDPNFAASMATQLGALDTRLDTIEAGGSLVKKYATTIGNASATAFTVTHNLNTRDVIVSIYEVANNEEWDLPDVVHTSVNSVTLTFSTAPTSGQFRVVVVG
jgi:hypothetical protein